MKKMKFEEKITELEKIINQLENGEIDLDESIESYTKAMKLIKECDEELKSVEEKMNFILNNDGNLDEFKIEE